MSTPMSKYSQLEESQLTKMIDLTATRYPFLDFSSKEALLRLGALMIGNPIMFEVKPTPIRSSFEFLRKISVVLAQMKGLEPYAVMERDFIFAIKMFGLAIRLKGGVHQFLASGKVDLQVDEETLISSAEEARSLEFYISDITKHTKIQTNAIESATNRLQRDWREMLLAKEFGALMDAGSSIGAARAKIMQEWEVREHEFVRIRQIAMEQGWFVSKRQQSDVSRRVTLDDDVAPYIQELRKTLAEGKKRLTTSQAVNLALRRLKDGMFVDQGVDVPPFQAEAGD